VQLAEYEVVARMKCAKKSEFFTCITRLKRAKNKLKLTLILISCKEIGNGRKYKNKYHTKRAVRH
jgi:hypothetical protein